MTRSRTHSAVAALLVFAGCSATLAPPASAQFGFPFPSLPGGVIPGQPTTADQQQAQTILLQMQADAQKQQAERFKIIKETQDAIFKLQQDIINNRTPAQDKAFRKWEEYIRGDVPVDVSHLVTYEEFLKQPVFIYTPSRQNESAWLYAPWGGGLSAAGTSGYDAVPWVSRFGYGAQFSLAGYEGSTGGFYPLLADLYSANREYNKPGSRELAEIQSRAGALPGIGGKIEVAFLDPSIKLALANGLAVDILRNAGVQSTVTVPGTGSTGGFSDVSIVLPLLFRVFDFGTVDGDRVTLTVMDQTGTRYTESFTLVGPNQNPPLIAPQVVPGAVQISVTALNEGSLSPNTGQLDVLSTVLSGTRTQQYNLRTGETGVLRITTANPGS